MSLYSDVPKAARLDGVSDTCLNASIAINLIGLEFFFAWLITGQEFRWLQVTGSVLALLGFHVLIGGYFVHRAAYSAWKQATGN
jgi:hypothetical protein